MRIHAAPLSASLSLSLSLSLVAACSAAFRDTEPDDGPAVDGAVAGDGAVGLIDPAFIPGGNHRDCTAVKTDRSAQSTAFVTVDGDTLAARVVDEDGVELDAFSIRK